MKLTVSNPKGRLGPTSNPRDCTGTFRDSLSRGLFLQPSFDTVSGTAREIMIEPAADSQQPAASSVGDNMRGCHSPQTGPAEFAERLNKK